MVQPLHSPKDEGDKHKPEPEHPNREVKLKDLASFEERLKDFIERQLWQTATKQDLLATEKRLTRLIKQPRFDWTIGPVVNKVQNRQESMEIKLTNEQQVSVTLAPKTDAGRPAKLDGKPTWEVITGESTVTVSEDGLSATIVSADNPGDTQILVKADADLGEGYVEISEVLDVKVAGASASNLGVVVGTPELKPVA